MRVLITGATGFIGSRLCEVLSLGHAFEARALVHSTASGSRIARFPIDFVTGDICDRDSVNKAIRDCDAVVHLARGDKKVTRDGLKNVLRAAVDHQISRFVHLSSVAVYGNNPPPESVSEAAAAKRTEMQYGNEKLDQEHCVLRYTKRHGLPAVILRPPNVYGPASWFTLGMVNKIRSGALAIVDEGRTPCNLVYIDNLVQAILLALWKPEAIGQVFFITDAETVSWEQCLEDHSKLVGVTVPRVSSACLSKRPGERVFSGSLKIAPGVLLSGELRTVLRQIPVFGVIEKRLYGCFQWLPADVQQTLRLWFVGPSLRPRNPSSQKRFDSDDNLIAAQARTVAHSSEKARQLLGYTAPISYHEGMELTEAWLRYARII
jgi:nucleoside-diphosphate-sugar epimerase